MKNYPRFPTAATLAVTLLTTACVKNGTTPVDTDGVRFSADIAGVAKPATRAANTTWEKDDPIGIFMVGHGGTTIVNGTSNLLYMAADGGDGVIDFSPGPETDGIRFPASGTVDFISYYPWKDGSTLETSIPVTIGDQNDQPSFDLLWAKATGTGGAGYTKGSGTVALTFDHKLTRIVMTAVAGEGVSGDLSEMEVKITGTLTSNTFDLATGELDAPGGEEASAGITARVLGEGVYDAIVMPCEYGAGEVLVTFDLGGEIFTWNVGAIDFEPQKQYNYRVSLSRTGVTVTGTITPWESQEMTEVNAN